MASASRSKANRSKSNRVLDELLELAFQNLTLLQCPFAELGEKNSVSIQKSMFEKPNTRGLITICYFLFHKLERKKCLDVFKHCYPTYYKKDQQEFQKICISWLRECAKDTLFDFPSIGPALFMKASGPETIKFVYTFSVYVLDACCRRLCPDEDMILQPPTPCQDPRLEDFQKAALKSATCCAMCGFTETLQVSRELDFEVERFIHSMLSRYREREKWMVELRNEKLDLLGKLKIPVPRKSNAPNQDGIKKLENELRSELKSVMKKWDFIISKCDETGVEREIVGSILSQSSTAKTLSSADLGLKIPSSLIKDCNQEIADKVGTDLYRSETLDLVSLIKLTNIAVQQILSKMHKGIPDFESVSVILKANNIVHSKQSSHLSALLNDLRCVTTLSEEINVKLRNKVDDCIYKEEMDKTVLIPGLVAPENSSTTTNFDPNDSLNIPRVSPPLQFTDNDILEETGAPEIPLSPSVIRMISVLPPFPELTVESSTPHYTVFDSPQTPPISQSPLVATRNQIEFSPEPQIKSPVPGILDDCVSPSNTLPLIADLPKPVTTCWETDGASSQLKGGHLLLGPSSPLKHNLLDVSFELINPIENSCPLKSPFRPVPTSDSSTIIQQSERKKRAVDNLVQHVVDFTLQRSQALSVESPLDYEWHDGFDLTRQLDNSVFTSVDKVARTPP